MPQLLEGILEILSSRSRGTNKRDMHSMRLCSRKEKRAVDKGVKLMPTMRDMTAERNKLRRELLQLVETVESFLVLVDAEMQKPSTVNRGSRVANLCNVLEFSKDTAKRYGLGKSLKRHTTRVLQALDERKRAAELVRKYLMFTDQRAFSWHEAHDCMVAILDERPEFDSPTSSSTR